MNSKTRYIACALLASTALLLEAPQLSAQAPAPPPPRAPAGAPPPVAVTTERAAPSPADPPSLSLKLEAGKLTAAMEQLQSALEAANKSGVNVIYGPGVQNLEIPQLTLRKVSGTDAVRLIAVSAGCTVEVILGDRSDAIGYKIVAPSQDGLASLYGGAGMWSGARPSWRPDRATAKSEKGPSPGPPAAASGSFPSQTNENNPLVGRSAIASNSVIGFTSPTQAGPNVRVYSLGQITTIVKFGDVVQTLEDLLKSSGMSLETAKLAVHEKTNVLFVTGDQRVQELVEQLLEALQKNMAVANARDDSRRDLIEMEVRLNAERDQAHRLKSQLEESQAQLFKLQRELDRVSHGAAPTPK